MDGMDGGSGIEDLSGVCEKREEIQLQGRAKTMDDPQTEEHLPLKTTVSITPEVRQHN